MPQYQITVKAPKNSNGVRVERGMSVTIVTQSYSNPLVTNGGQEVADGFMRIYGIDLRKAGALNAAYLEVKQL